MNSGDHAAVICDFDGTIVNVDTAEVALDHFVGPSWRVLDEKFERGEISFEASLQKEFAMIRAPEQSIVKELDKVTRLRPNFEKLVRYCKAQDSEVVILSGGLDFYIRHFLEFQGLLTSVRICAPKSRVTSNGIELMFPTLIDKNSENFKDDFVKQHKRLGQKIFFVGNGLGDYSAAKIADYAFAIKDSRLAELCAKRGVSCTEITDFQEVVATIDRYMKADAGLVR